MTAWSGAADPRDAGMTAWSGAGVTLAWCSHDDWRDARVTVGVTVGA